MRNPALELGPKSETYMYLIQVEFLILLSLLFKKFDKF